MIADPVDTLPTMVISDMRAREIIQAGDHVRCPGGIEGAGRVLAVEPDGRLARVEWGCSRVGWWYLKDLRIVR